MIVVCLVGHLFFTLRTQFYVKNASLSYVILEGIDQNTIEQNSMNNRDG